MNWVNEIKFNGDGLVPAIAQCAQTKDILMMAWMNRESLEATVKEGRAVYYSRSRQRLWRKGESSGNVQRIVDILLDCDGDTIVLKVDQLGNIACHTGRRSCFYRTKCNDDWLVNQNVIKDPKAMYDE